MIAADKIRLWRERPDVFVREVFGVTPDAWQDEELRAFPNHQRIALKACKGPGKTAFLAWIAWNYLLTRPHPKIAATSITADNLSDGLWTEMSKWQQRSPLLSAAFEWTKTRIFAKDHPETWWMAARNWPKSGDPSQQANTLAGLHADYMLFLLDESGGIPDGVMAAAEASLATCIEGHILQAGNPTHLTGPLYRACTTESRLWRVREITADPDDPARTPRVSLQWAKEQIEKYGRDNPWVLINVYGKFPPGSLNALIGPDEVREAMQRHYQPEVYQHAAKVLGVDVARFGDDRSPICPRQGKAALAPIILRNVDGVQGAGNVARKWNEWKADACFIDGTGGYGSSWIDHLRLMNYDPVDVQFAGKPTDGRYANKRAEMWFTLVEWIREGGALPNLPEMIPELTETTYSFKGDKLILEPKDQIKARLGFSPDLADGYALTFAFPVQPKSHLAIIRNTAQSWDYNPLT